MKELIRLLAAKIGHIPDLDTAEKTQVVLAINELVAVKALLNGDLAVNFNTKNLVVAGQISSPIYDNVAAVAVNWNNGNTQKITLSGANNPANITFTNDIVGAYYTLILDVTVPSMVVNWPLSILWPSDVSYIKNNLFIGKFIVNMYKISNTEIIGNIGGPFI